MIAQIRDLAFAFCSFFLLFALLAGFSFAMGEGFRDSSPDVPFYLYIGLAGWSILSVLVNVIFASEKSFQERIYEDVEEHGISVSRAIAKDFGYAVGTLFLIPICFALICREFQGYWPWFRGIDANTLFPWLTFVWDQSFNAVLFEMPTIFGWHLSEAKALSMPAKALIFGFRVLMEMIVLRMFFRYWLLRRSLKHGRPYQLHKLDLLLKDADREREPNDKRTEVTPSPHRSAFDI